MLDFLGGDCRIHLLVPYSNGYKNSKDGYSQSPGKARGIGAKNAITGKAGKT